MTLACEPNGAQALNWKETTGRVWADAHEPLDRQLAPLGRAAMAALEPRTGERILDIGCGAGDTSLQLAEAVGPDGHVLGVDVSTPLLAVARRRAEGIGNLSFAEGDAQTHGFAPGAFDAVFSRFGVMFFAGPPAAFANIRRALKTGGRLAFVCWRAPGENPVMVLPMTAATPLLPEPPAPPVPGAPGPFAFADPEHVRRILETAGFADIAIAPHDEMIGSGGLATALDLALRIGPLGTILRENPDLTPQVTSAVRAALQPHDGPDGVKLASATWIVTARAP